MTIKEYEAIDAIRVSEIVRYATKDINSIITDIKVPKETSDSMLLGTAFHSLVLRKDRSNLPEDICIIDSDSYRTKDAKEKKQEALENGMTPILIHQYDNMIAGINYASKVLDRYFNPETCEFERAFIADDETFGKVKGRIDGIQNGCVNDLKYSKNQINLDKKIFDMGYQLQMYIYMELSGLDTANLVFFDPDTYLIQVKTLHKSQIQQECISLILRAKKNMALVESYKKGELNEIESTEYETPQWAFTYLMEN